MTREEYDILTDAIAHYSEYMDEVGRDDADAAT
ncbi:hypothetical protein LCGC14_1640510, partial [marine sediment metagenome]